MWCKNIWWCMKDLLFVIGGFIGSGWCIGSSKKNKIWKLFMRFLGFFIYLCYFIIIIFFFGILGLG